VSVFAYSLPLRDTEPIGQNNLCATFRFADGSIATLAYCTVGSKASSGERVECFAQGFGVTTENFRSLAIHEGSSKRQKSFFGDKGYDAQMRSFIKAVREGGSHPVTVIDGARATLGCLKMLESARSGEPAAIALDSLLS
jgi:hypothetical protein